MVRLNIELSEDLRAKAEIRAAEQGYPSVESYLDGLLRADVDAPPPAQTYHTPDQLQDKLEAGLASGPAAVITESDWERKRRKLSERAPGR